MHRCLKLGGRRVGRCDWPRLEVCLNVGRCGLAGQGQWQWRGCGWAEEGEDGGGSHGWDQRAGSAVSLCTLVRIQTAQRKGGIGERNSTPPRGEVATLAGPGCKRTALRRSQLVPAHGVGPARARPTVGGAVCAAWGVRLLRRVFHYSSLVDGSDCTQSEKGVSQAARDGSRWGEGTPYCTRSRRGRRGAAWPPRRTTARG